ncbi:MAG: hydantoinase/oxoprolinase family protein [Alphaproteobacteria bacterium]|jgi:N-methylhydantoinase A|nr:hydantoinase/oxoprolinase family protein [Alphaproteobacteria bacterium]
MTYRVGIDIGGTFTDMVFLTGTGGALTLKVPSTPDDYSRGIAEGLVQVFEGGAIDGTAIDEVIHGTTIATNAILERRGVKTGLITTEGFRDVLEIRRLRMPRLYDLTWEKPKALAARADRIEVTERVDHQGGVLIPLDEDSARAAIDRLIANEVEAIAVSLINAYANGAHEQRILELIREKAPDLPVCISSEILPEIKEYERTSTAVVNAYILPVVAHYLTALSAALERLGIESPLLVMQSSGGAMGVAAACQRPIHIIESGPAAGVVGGAEVAAKLGFEDTLTFDMGGTTAKAAIIEGGAFDRVGEMDVGAGINFAARLLKGGGHHVRVPAIDIAEVGAGGGSLVRIDAGGALAVGPESAGAVPGPICYRQGGTVPTVTDANVVLGFVNPDYLVGGELALDAGGAAVAIEEQIAKPLGVSVDEAAFGIHRVANATMARALRSVSSERGRDPRRFALMAFGGNGPVHAATLARSLDITTILVPPTAGVFSALGLLFPATEHHYVRTFKREVAELRVAEVEAAYGGLEADGRHELAGEGYGEAAMEFERFADLRYRGENTELTVPAGGGNGLVDDMVAAFGAEHERTYGYQSDDEVVELVNLRLIARGLSEEKRVPDALEVTTQAGADMARQPRSVYFGPEHGRMETEVVDREAISPEWRAGPLIIEEYDSTTVVPPDCRIRRVDWQVLEIDVGRQEAR